MRLRQMIFLTGWVVFILYALLLAPDGNLGYLNQLITMNDPDPFLLMVFSFLGIYPLLYVALLIDEDRSGLPLWPFLLGMFMLGAFALMPYFFLSRARNKREGRIPYWLVKVFHARMFISFLVVVTIALLWYGVSQGYFWFYWHDFQTSNFVHVMTIDFMVLSILTIFVIYWKERRYGKVNRMHWFGSIPILGALFYMFIRKG
ncbi:hypothetical protein [Halobacillus faecis]|uniref:DUF2834 domain-containing protein n=1 Tax=Halobacillus faecis TaxID=360184 RepID=A0A511WW80_9BACI|nr:hypothetical protein [Halobacillus faecis]GEN54538.1 hypothetical protein HFA01_28000 [Halobacillus faecis]